MTQGDDDALDERTGEALASTLADPFGLDAASVRAVNTFTQKSVHPLIGFPEEAGDLGGRVGLRAAVGRQQCGEPGIGRIGRMDRVGHGGECVIAQWRILLR